MSKIVLFIQKEMGCGCVIKEEESCCAGLAEICLDWGVPACPGACFEEAWGKAALHTGTSGYCFWLGRVVFLHARLQHRMQIASQGTTLCICGRWLGFLPMQKGFIGMY